jgi:hypothetical protein
MKKLVISTLFVMQVLLVFAQTTTGVTGKVVDSKTQKPLQNVVVAILNSPLTELTDGAGKFTFKELSEGNQLLQIKTQGYTDQLIQLEITSGKLLDLGVVLFVEDQTQEQQLSLITITENDLGDDNSGSESTAGLLQASRDAFQQAAAFNWGQARFRIRGLDNEYGTTMINGVTMNKIYDGRPQWGNWGGLNDATRNQEFTMGSTASDYTFGGILGTQEINTRASIYRKGSRVSFAGTNTNYSWRTMGTHASGMNANGWAFVISAGRRWAQEGYFEGTDYAANSVFASVEKKFNDKHSINFTSIYAQNSRGKNSPNTQEVINLAGERYNSYWGWQDGKKRNSRDRDLEEPLNILSHYWKITEKTTLNTNVMYQIGSIGNSRIDSAEQANALLNDNSSAFLPDPTYYKNLPSYYTSLWNQDDYTDFQGDDPVNIANANNVRNQFLANKQMNWDAMYRINLNSPDGRSNYILYEDRTDDRLFVANSILNSKLADHIVLNAGATYRNLRSKNFQNVLDLLGGTYFSDTDGFYSGDQAQPDLNNPNRRVGVGDKYGYNYILNANTFDAFTQFKFTYKKIDFYLAQSFTSTNYQRDGLYKNGLYATNSFGKSENVHFENFGFKGGLTYKITGRQFLTFNGVHMTKAPSMRNTFNNARLNNNIVGNLQSERVSSLDASYVINAPKFKMRLTGFMSKSKNATNNTFFYAEGAFEEDESGDGSDAFVGQTTTNIAKKNIGVEFGGEYNITSTLKATVAASYGQYTYDNNPNVILTNDALASANNPNPIIDFGKATLKDYRQAGSPQQAYTFGLEYRDPKFWWVGANLNYLADTYIDISHLLRTSEFFRNPADPFGLPFPEATVEGGRKLLKQEKLDPISLLNLTGGKSWRISGNTFGFFASINNVLDLKYKTGGFEQPRNANYRELNQDVASGTPAFAPKYFYGFGRNFFVNLYVNF